MYSNKKRANLAPDKAVFFIQKVAVIAHFPMKAYVLGTH